MAVTDQDVAAIHHMLAHQMAQGAARAPVSPEKSMRAVYDVVTSKEGAAAWMAFADGKFVGTMGIVQTDFWYADDGFLYDKWLYVLPEYENCGALSELLKEAQAAADVAGMELIITILNKSRRRGARREHVAMLYSYQPAGNVYAFNPKGS